MIRKYLAAATFVVAVLPSISLAQMYKCIGPNGQITFTKHGCATDNDTAKIEVGRVNSQDSRAARQNIEEYEYRRSARPQGTQVTVIADPRIAERQAKARNDLCREANTAYKGAQNRQLTARQRAMSAGCASGASAQEIERISLDHKQKAAASNPAPSAPSVITNCDQTGCWDNQGGRYNQGAGSTYIRNDGRACQSVGGQMICN